MQGMDKAIKFVYEFFWNGEGTDGLFATVLKESGRGMQSDRAIIAEGARKQSAESYFAV